MGSVVKLLQAIANLTRSGAIKSLDDAYRLAQRELGERFAQYKNQIKDAFDAGSTKPSNVVPFRKKEGIESLSKGRVKKPGEVIEASFKPGVDKRGKRVEESPSQASGASPLMQRLGEGIETLKTMKKSGMDPTVALTKTLARSILNKKGIEVPERVDPIEVLAENFGADVLMDTRNIADELLELQRMGKGTKGIDEVLEQEGMFDIQINKDAPKGLSQEELRQIKKEVDQEKMFEDFDPTDRDPNAMGGIMRANYKIGSGIRLAKFLASKGKNLKQEIKNAVDNIFTTGDSKYDADVALDSMLEELDVDRDIFDQKDIIDAYGMAYQQLTAPIIKNLKTPKGIRPTKPEKSIKSMKETGSMDISDPEIASEFDRFMKETDPEGYKKMEEAMKKAADEAQPLEYALGTRKKNSEGGLNYLMGM